LSLAYRRGAAHPPASLGDSVLAQLPEKNGGIGFIGGGEDYDGEEDPEAQCRSRTMCVVVGIVLVMGALAVVIVLNPGALRLSSSVDDADDTVTVDAEMEDGTATGHFSASEDAAYWTFENIPELSEDETYQVWLFEEPGGSVVSV